MKKNRQGKILEIIQEREIGTQEELVESLEQAGFRVTQATVSRDIRELRLYKEATQDGGQRYVAHGQEESQLELEERYVRILQEAYLSVEAAMNLVVVKTVPGMAMAAAAALDAMALAEVAGCIAGDDTIFVAVYSGEEVRHLVDRIRKIVL